MQLAFPWDSVFFFLRSFFINIDPSFEVFVDLLEVTRNFGVMNLDICLLTVIVFDVFQFGTGLCAD